MAKEEKNTIWGIERVTEELAHFLKIKNSRYGDAALKPSKIFNREEALNSLSVRIDDKINRIKNSKEPRKNDVVDLIGYLVLYCIKKEWYSFRDLID
jgi:hypothetical protein